MGTEYPVWVPKQAPGSLFKLNLRNTFAILPDSKVGHSQRGSIGGLTD